MKKLGKSKNERGKQRITGDKREWIIRERREREGGKMKREL